MNNLRNKFSYEEMTSVDSEDARKEVFPVLNKNKDKTKDSYIISVLETALVSKL